MLKVRAPLAEHLGDPLVLGWGYQAGWNPGLSDLYMYLNIGCVNKKHFRSDTRVGQANGGTHSSTGWVFQGKAC